MGDEIRQQVQALQEEMVRLRRDFHRHPELGFEEHRTASVIAEYLTALGFQVRTGVAETGVVAVWPGKNTDGKTIAFRADIDALKLTEENQHDFRSETPGKMHGCGHDGHMAILLGLAKWIAESGRDFPGNIKLIFQPAEEGGGGAKVMVEQNALEQPRVDRVVGLHLWLPLKIGQASVVEGAILGSVDGFTITVKGKGGHSAMPHTAVDSLVVAAHIVIALQTIVSRNVDPLQSAVITVGEIRDESAVNVISEKAVLRGMARTSEPELRKLVEKRIRECAQGVAAGLGAQADVEWSPLYPATISDPAVVTDVRNSVRAVLGADCFVEERTMASEDFSFFLEQRPGCYFFLGASNVEKGITEPHHSPRFDFDETALGYGLEIFIRVLLDFFGA